MRCPESDIDIKQFMRSTLNESEEIQQNTGKRGEYNNFH